MTESHDVRLVRTAIDRLVEELEAGQSVRLRAYLSAMARFHRYSLGNVLLISLSCPHATRVAGYNAWRKLGRQVRKGERGIRILAPVVYRGEDETSRAERVVAFRTAYVFDVSQTDGPPLPEFARVGGEPGPYLTRLRAGIAERGIALQYVDGPAGLEGWSAGGRIAVRRGLRPAEEFSVLLHELTHEWLHGGDREAGRTTIRETEAEAVAFVVCQAIGLETNGAAADYIRLYAGDRKTLLASLDRIQRTAAMILDDLLDPYERSATTGEPLSLVVQRPAA